jgi:hypothetical protein
MKYLRHLLAIVATPLLLAVNVNAATDGTAGPNQERYELRVRSTATALGCDASHEFRREVKVCDSSGSTCRTQDTSESLGVDLEVAEGETITVLTSVSYVDEGVVYADAASERLQAGITGSFTHSVSGKGHCMRSISYVLRAAP